MEPKNQTGYDYVNPDHYKKFSKEVIQMMIDIWGYDNVIAYCQITAFKYKMRAGDKPNEPIERDIEKANWYLNKAKELVQLNPGPSISMTAVSQPLAETRSNEPTTDKDIVFPPTSDRKDFISVDGCSAISKHGTMFTIGDKVELDTRVVATIMLPFDTDDSTCEVVAKTNQGKVKISNIVHHKPLTNEKTSN